MVCLYEVIPLTQEEESYESRRRNEMFLQHSFSHQDLLYMAGGMYWGTCYGTYCRRAKARTLYDQFFHCGRLLLRTGFGVWSHVWTLCTLITPESGKALKSKIKQVDDHRCLRTVYVQPSPMQLAIPESDYLDARCHWQSLQVWEGLRRQESNRKK